MASSADRVVVIGSGIGGAGCAALLQKQGFDVTVLERNSYPGGKGASFTKDGFTYDTGVVLVQVMEGDVAWGDYDLDGYLDILLTGRINLSDPVTRLYHNNGDRTFTESTDAGLEKVSSSSVAWGDTITMATPISC